MRRFIIPLLFLLLAVQHSLLAADAVPGTFAIGPDSFLLNGKPIQLISGEMHYARIPPEYWEQRLQMARAMGLNSVTVYCFWNIHEPEPGQWNFKFFGDVARFCRLAQQQGLYVILRPGPYVCAEWDFGGFPAWLLRDPEMKVRSTYPGYEKAADDYLMHLGQQLAPLQITRGGPIIMVQLENEYGSYDKDKTYLAHLRDSLHASGFEVPLFTADGGGRMMANGSLSGVLPGLNGGNASNVVREVGKYFPKGPYMVPEFYPGWLDHWGERHSTNGTAGVVKGLEALLDKNVSVSLYMFHGGTNWDGMSGANFGGHYQPQPTSYDYDAPLDEAGRPTAKYFALREAIIKHLGADAGIPSVPKPNPVIAIPPIALNESAGFLDHLHAPVEGAKPVTMEMLKQNYGYVLYRTTLPAGSGGKLVINGLADYAQVFIDDKPVAVLDRRLKESTAELPVQTGPAKLDILVEDDGRVNYGGQILNNRKGINGDVTLDGKVLSPWQTFSMPLPDVSTASFSAGSKQPPALFHGTFTLTQVGDTFLDMRGWTKGWVWVNGHNLGRYWFIGPQQTLYLPGCWLKQGENSIVVLEQQKLPDHLTVTGLTEPILDKVINPNTVARGRRWPKAPDLGSVQPVASGDFVDNTKVQDVKFAPTTGRYICLQALSSQKGDNFASAAEITASDANGQPIPRKQWTIIYADSEENLSEDTPAENVLDGDAGSIWHTRYNGAEPPYPHLIVIDTGHVQPISAVQYLSRDSTSSPGRIKGYKIYILPEQQAP